MSFFITLQDHEINQKSNFHVQQNLIDFWHTRKDIDDFFLIDLAKRNINYQNVKKWSDITPKNHTGILVFSTLEFLKNKTSKEHLDDFLFCCTSYVCILKEHTNVNIDCLNIQRLKETDVIFNANVSLHVQWPKTPKKFSPKLVVDNDL
jgi:hypothetical protein